MADELDGDDAVGGEPVAAGEPAEAASERVADHADVGRGSGKAGQPVLGRGHAYVLPENACLGAGRARLGVDLEAAQARGLHEDGVVEGTEGVGEMAGALRRQAEAPVAGKADHRDDVVDRLGIDNGSGSLVGRQVPGAAGLVPLRVTGRDYIAVENVAERAKTGLFCMCGERSGHRVGPP